MIICVISVECLGVTKARYICRMFYIKLEFSMRETKKRDYERFHSIIFEVRVCVCVSRRKSREKNNVLVFNRQYSHSIHYSKFLLLSDHEQYIRNKFIDVHIKKKSTNEGKV